MLFLWISENNLFVMCFQSFSFCLFSIIVCCLFSCFLNLILVSFSFSCYLLFVFFRLGTENCIGITDPNRLFWFMSKYLSVALCFLQFVNLECVFFFNKIVLLIIAENYDTYEDDVNEMTGMFFRSLY